MFDLFFKECETRVFGYKGYKKDKFFGILIASFFLLIVSFATLLFCVFCHKNFILLSIIVIVFIIIIGSVVGWLKKKNLQKDWEKNFNDRIYNLKKLLEDNKYKMHTSKGLDYLIKNCEEKITPKTLSETFTVFKNLFVILVFPLIALLIGTFIGEIGINGLDKYINVTYGGVIAIALSVALFLIVKPIFPYYVYKYKPKYECLRDDLEYLKTQLPD